MKYLLITFFCVALFAGFHAGGQTHFVAEYLTGNNGLPHYQVNTIEQDWKGYVWIGTRNGLSRYDGYSVKNYYHHDTGNNSLRHNYVRKVFEDSERHLWVLTLYGISRYRPETDDFVNYPEVDADMTAIAETPDGNLFCGGSRLYLYDRKSDRFKTIGLDIGFIISLAADNRGNIYISTNNAILRLDFSERKVKKLDRSLFEDFTSGAGDIIPLFVDSDNNLWIGRNGRGITCHNLDSGNTEVIDGDKLPSGIVRVITEDGYGRILAGTETGVAIIEPGKKSAIPERIGELAGSAVYSIMADSSKRIWVGTYFGGITILSDTATRFTHISPETGSGMTGNVVRMMAEPSPGSLWIATEDEGIDILDMATGKMKSFMAIPEIGKNVHSLCFDAGNNCMWIGSFLNGLFRYDMSTGAYRQYKLTTGLASNSVFYLALDSNGRLCVATPRGLRIYDADTDSFTSLGHKVLDDTFIYTLLPDKNGNLWVGTTTEGLFRIDGKTKLICHWPDTPKFSKFDSARFITTLYQDEKGRMWIGTNNGGLLIVENNGNINRSNENDNRTICAIIPDSSGKVWVSSSTGLFKYDASGNEIAHYTADNGLPTNHMNLSSAFRGSDSRIYIGSVNGLIRFSPAETEPAMQQMAVRLKSLSVNGKDVASNDSTGLLKQDIDYTDEVRLPYDMGRLLTVEYGVVMPEEPQAVSYQVMLEGTDRYWRNVGQERRLSLFNLAPGDYNLNIRANNRAYGWDKMPVKTLRIVVCRPFYRTTVAYTVYAVLGCVCLVFILRRKGRHKASAAVENATYATNEDDSKHLNHIEREFLGRIDSLISENLSNSDLCIDDITKHMGMSRTLLHNRIKALTGMSMSEYLREKRFIEAARLLADGYNVSETSFQCGFADPNHFSKMFKKRFGVLPSRYADKNQQ